MLGVESRPTLLLRPFGTRRILRLLAQFPLQLQKQYQAVSRLGKLNYLATAGT